MTAKREDGTIIKSRWSTVGKTEWNGTGQDGRASGTGWGGTGGGTGWDGAGQGQIR